MTITFAMNDFGLGTAYERLAVYRLFDRWLGRRQITSAFEGPVDGMAGIAGMHLVGLARRGVPVTVGLTDRAALDNVRRIYRALGVEAQLTTRLFADDEPLPVDAFDLALTYNAFPLIEDWRGLLHRVAATSRRWVLVAVTNPYSYGVSIRKAMRVAERARREELFDHPSTQPATIEPELETFGRIVDHAYFDCPWWPDLFVDAGESLFGATLKRLPIVGPMMKNRLSTTESPGSFIHGAAGFPFFDGTLDGPMAKHPVFDWAPEGVARRFGHLHAYLVERTR